MASRTVPGVTVTLLPDNEQEHFRLFELAPELLAALTSKKPPILELKSREESSGNSKTHHVVLCTQDRTYDLRQVSTSNSVYLTRPTQLGIQATAICDSTMEMLSSSMLSPESYIQAALPIYSALQHVGISNPISKNDVFSNVPLSSAECEKGWSNLACFELPNPPSCFVPSAEVRVQVWDGLLTAALAERLDLTSCPASHILDAAQELREEWPVELISAIIASTTLQRPDSIPVVDAERCVRFVGINRLQVSSKGSHIDTASFITRWKDAVPEQWRGKCELSVLHGACKLSESGKDIVFVASNGSIHGKAPSISDQETRASLGAKRKWHEKFRASRP